MHRDTKLGLALGMLVIGFAVAFCFPRAPASHVAESEVLASPELAFIPVKAYPSAVDAADESTSRPGPTSADATPSVPEPVQEVPVPEPEVSTEVNPATVEVQATGEAPAIEPVVRLHQVQVGETLSGIALKYLGSSQRYYEIYEANQDQLSTPDAVKVGMALRIPDPAARTVVVVPAASEDDPQPTLAFPLKHTIRPGDTLEGISRRYYGEARFVPEIRTANPMLANPQKLTVGQVLELPVVR